MVKCLICGLEKEYSIKDHLKWSHGLNKQTYQELYPNAEITSKKHKEMVSKRIKKMWGNNEFKEKMCKSRKESHNTPEFKTKMSKIIKEKHLNNPELFSGFTNYHKTEDFKKWVVSKERCDKISKSSKKRWENDEYKEKVINSIKQKLNDGRCKKNKEFKEKMSSLMTNLYENGVLTNNMNKYINGWYLAKNGEKYYYASSYELNAMKFFDKSKNVLEWTNKHKIRIKYIFNGTNRYYLPDFLVKLANGTEYIIEMKGWETERVKVKTKFAIQEYGDKYQIFFNNKNLEKFINENK